MQFIDLNEQYKRIQSLINDNIANVLNHGQYIMGPEILHLEEALAKWVDMEHCITLSSGTDALYLALLALGIGPGDEVITTPFSFFATVEVILLAGATPVFVDVDPLTFNIKENEIEQAITPKTKAILPVSLYGQCADMDTINAIAARHQLAVIEDAAQSFGATYKNKKSCSLSTIACTSFFPSKPLGCYGDGGACFTRDPSLAQALRELRNHGQRGRYNHVRLGLNARMDTLQAAIVLAKLAVFEEEVELRQEVAARYSRLLCNFVDIPYISAYNTSVYAQYTVRVNQREKVIKHLTAKGIPTAIHYPKPLHLQPALADCTYQQGDYPHAELASEQVLSIPMHPYLNETDQNKIAEVLKEIVTSKAVEEEYA